MFIDNAVHKFFFASTIRAFLVKLLIRIIECSIRRLCYFVVLNTVSHLLPKLLLAERMMLMIFVVLGCQRGGDVHELFYVPPDVASEYHGVLGNSSHRAQPCEIGH